MRMDAAFLVCFSCTFLQGAVEKPTAVAPKAAAKLLLRQDVHLVARSFSWIDTERTLAGMAKPQKNGHIDLLKQNNIGTIITLTETPLEAELQDPAITYVHIPVQDFKPPTLEQINTAMQAIDDAHQKGKAAVVHCRAGIGRTGTMLACWLVKNQNLTADQAIKKIRTQRRGSVETSEQIEAVRQYWQSLQKKTVTASQPETSDECGCH